MLAVPERVRDLPSRGRGVASALTEVQSLVRFNEFVGGILLQHRWREVERRAAREGMTLTRCVEVDEDGVRKWFLAGYSFD